MRFFGKLHDFKERFGLKITLYCFWEIGDGLTFCDIPGRNMYEFSENSKWLNFGFHSKNYEPFYQSFSWEESFDEFTKCVKHFEIGGTDILRLHYWKATEKQKRKLSSKGILTLLSPPNSKELYYENGIYYRRTNTYFEKVNENITDSILEIGNSCLIAFTHEKSFENQISKIEVALKFYKKNNYCFLT